MGFSSVRAFLSRKGGGDGFCNIYAVVSRAVSRISRFHLLYCRRFKGRDKLLEPGRQVCNSIGRTYWEYPHSFIYFGNPGGGFICLCPPPLSFPPDSVDKFTVWAGDRTSVKRRRSHFWIPVNEQRRDRTRIRRLQP